MTIPGVRAPVLAGPAPVDYTPLLGALKQQAAPTNFGPKAQALAGADVAAAVAGIRAQQDEIRRQAGQQAGQVNDAALAASKFLASLGLGDAVAADYANAAAAQRAAASGYAGGLRSTVDAAAADVQHNLQGLGSAQQAPNQGAAAGNVLYGLGGNLPATTLDVVGPTVASSVRALPAQTLGYGQAQAVGIQGAGAQHAAELDANVAAEQAKRSSIAADYFKQLSDAARQAGQDRVADTLKVLGLQQSANAAAARTAAENASLQLRADTANQSTSLRVADLNATQHYHDQQAAALAKYHAGVLTLGEYNAETSRIRAKQAAAKAATKAAQPNVHIANGYAYTIHPDGSVTTQKLPSGTKTPGGGLSRSASLTKQGKAAFIANASFWGVTDKNGVYHQPMHYQDAMENMRQAGIPLAIAQQALNRWWSVPGFEADPASRHAAYDATTGSGDAGKIVWDRATAGRGRPLDPYQSPRRARARKRKRR